MDWIQTLSGKRYISIKWVTFLPHFEFIMLKSTNWIARAWKTSSKIEVKFYSSTLFPNFLTFLLFMLDGGFICYYFYTSTLYEILLKLFRISFTIFLLLDDITSWKGSLAPNWCWVDLVVVMYELWGRFI